MNKKNQHITISGAGLVGSLLGLLLKKKGFRVSIYEKLSDIRKASKDSGRSINLAMMSRAVNALDRAKIAKDIIKSTVAVYGRVIHSKEGNLTYQPYGKDKNEYNFSVSRKKLNQILIDHAENAGVEFYFNHEITSVDLDNKKAIVEGTKEIAFDKLIGCDGVSSPIRKSLMKYFNCDDKNNINLLSHSYKEILMPADINGDYPIEKNAIHIWPRGTHMLMALPNLDGSFTMTIYLPNESDNYYSFEKLKKQEDVEFMFNKDFKDTTLLMPNYKCNFLENPKGTMGTINCNPWNYKGDVLLMGDSAHAIVPFFGQGMNCGFEDCVSLLDILDKSNYNWEEVFEQFNKIRKLNTDAIAKMSLENFIEMSESVGDKKFILKKRVESIIERNFSNIYRSRYAMVAYTLIPYSIAYEAGKIQNDILNELISSIDNEEQVDLNLAKKLIEDKYFSYIKSKNVSLETYKYPI